MSRFYHLSQRIFNQPVAILPQKAEIIVSALADRLGISKIMRHDGTAFATIPGEDYQAAAHDKISDYDVLDQCAIIEISGTLVQKNNRLRPFSGMTGYDGIRQNFLAALEDPAIKSIVLDIDSPGGEVAGCFDLVDTIYEARGVKPIAAILNESAYSAAYAIASAADFITVPRTGGVGSIGVICMHVDYSKSLQNSGIKVTLIQYGDKKSMGNSYEAIGDEALAKMQADIDMMGEMFVGIVARNRGISADVVRDFQAGTFLGKEGVDIGLADELISPHLAFQKLLDTIN